MDEYELIFDSEVVQIRCPLFDGSEEDRRIQSTNVYLLNVGIRLDGVK